MAPPGTSEYSTATYTGTVTAVTPCGFSGSGGSKIEVEFRKAESGWWDSSTEYFFEQSKSNSSPASAECFSTGIAETVQLFGIAKSESAHAGGGAAEEDYVEDRGVQKQGSVAGKSFFVTLAACPRQGYLFSPS